MPTLTDAQDALAQAQAHENEARIAHNGARGHADSLRQQLAAPVNLCETESFGNHCAVVSSSFGSLIHATVGNAGGSGALRTKRSG